MLPVLINRCHLPADDCVMRQISTMCHNITWAQMGWGEWVMYSPKEDSVVLVSGKDGWSVAIRAASIRGSRRPRSGSDLQIALPQEVAEKSPNRKHKSSLHSHTVSNYKLLRSNINIPFEWKNRKLPKRITAFQSRSQNIQIRSFEIVIKWIKMQASLSHRTYNQWTKFTFNQADKFNSIYFSGRKKAKRKSFDLFASARSFPFNSFETMFI